MQKNSKSSAQIFSEKVLTKVADKILSAQGFLPDGTEVENFQLHQVLFERQKVLVSNAYLRRVNR